MRICTLALVVSLAFTVSLKAQETIPGIGPVGKIQKLHTGFKFTEGPAADRQGNVYFTDIPQNKILKVDSAGNLTTFSSKSNHANGLMLNAAGELVACEMDGRIAAHNLKTGKRRSIVSTHDGARFNAPNDLVIDKTGGIYFTDPMFRAPKPLPQGKLSVYYITPKGKVTRVVEQLPNPNGVILSPDEKTLYVIPSSQSKMMAYPVIAPGKLGKGRVFCTLKQAPGAKNTGGDGLTIDTKGNLYITSRLGLQVFNPSGKPLGIISLPQQPSNVTFGGKELRTLYVTARSSLYTIPMEAKGHVFAAGN